MERGVWVGHKHPLKGSCGHPPRVRSTACSLPFFGAHGGHRASHRPSQEARGLVWVLTGDGLAHTSQEDTCPEKSKAIFQEKQKPLILQVWEAPSAPMNEWTARTRRAWLCCRQLCRDPELRRGLRCGAASSRYSVNDFYFSLEHKVCADTNTDKSRKPGAICHGNDQDGRCFSSALSELCINGNSETGCVFKKKKKDIKMIALLWIEAIHQIST